MKLLIFTDWFEPGFKAGGPAKSLKALISMLMDHFEIFMVTRDRDCGDAGPYENIEFEKWRPMNGYKIYYIRNGNISARHIRNIISEVEPGKIYLNSIYSEFTRSVLLARILYGKKTEIVICPRGELNEGSVSVKLWKKKPYLNVLKISGITRNLSWHASSEYEEVKIREWFNPGSIRYIPNIVIPNIISEKNYRKKASTLNLFSICRIAPVKNIFFLLEILHRLELPSPTWKYDIYGPVEDEPYFEKCRSFVEQSQILRNNVFFKGAIDPSRTSAAMAEYDFFVLPTLGENFGHSIFECFSNGTPVIISDETPWKNLEAANVGWNISLADESKWNKILLDCYQMGEATYKEMSDDTITYARQYLQEKNYKEQYIKLFS